MKKLIIAGAIVEAVILIAIMTQLIYPLDKNTKTLIANEVREEMTRSIFDVMWKKMFMWETFFETLDGYDTSGSTLYSNKVKILTGAGLNDTAHIQKNASYNGLLNFYNRSAFRSGFLTNGVAHITAYITVGGVQGGNNGYGFKIVNDKLYGVVHNGTSETTVELQTITESNYTVQAEYLPGNKVVFMVATLGGAGLKEKGVITTGLPQNKFELNTIPMNMHVKNTSDVARSLSSSFFQYMQYRHHTR